MKEVVRAYESQSSHGGEERRARVTIHNDHQAQSDVNFRPRTCKDHRTKITDFYSLSRSTQDPDPTGLTFMKLGRERGDELGREDVDNVFVLGGHGGGGIGWWIRKYEVACMSRLLIAGDVGC